MGDYAGISAVEAVGQLGLHYTEWLNQSTVVLNDFGLLNEATATRYITLLQSTNTNTLELVGCKLEGRVIGAYKPPGLKIRQPLNIEPFEPAPTFYPVIVGMVIFKVSGTEAANFTNYGQISFQNGVIPAEQGIASVFSKPDDMYAYQVFCLNGYLDSAKVLIGWLNSFVPMKLNFKDTVILAYRATDNWAGGGQTVQNAVLAGNNLYAASVSPILDQSGLGLTNQMLVSNAVKAYFAGTFSYKAEELPSDDPATQTR